MSSFTRESKVRLQYTYNARKSLSSKCKLRQWREEHTICPNRSCPHVMRPEPVQSEDVEPQSSQLLQQGGKLMPKSSEKSQCYEHVFFNVRHVIPNTLLPSQGGPGKSL